MRQENFLGIPINVMSPEDVADEAAKGDLHPYVVLRVADSSDLATPAHIRARRLRTLCEMCDQLCYVDPKSFDSLRGMKMMIVCTVCMVDRVDEVNAKVHAGRAE